MEQHILVDPWIHHVSSEKRRNELLLLRSIRQKNFFSNKNFIEKQN